MHISSNEAEALEKILRWRRDVRHFARKPIPEDIVERLELSTELAPSVGNSRPWRILRVESPHLREAVKADFERCNEEAASSYLPDTQAEYRALKLAGLDAAPLQLAIFSAVDPEAGRGLGRQTMHQALLLSTAMAIHTLWLTARAENLGLGIVSILSVESMERLFGLGAGWTFAAYLCIGWPEFSDDKPLLHRAGWQQSFPLKWEVC